MASTYVNDLRLNEMATGDQSGSWGTVTNTNLELIGEAFSYGTEAITTNADTHTTTIADGASDPGRAMFLKYTGSLDSACTITIGPNTVSKMWFIENATSGSQNIIISQGSGANVTIAAGQTKAVYSDGAGAGAAFVDAFAALSVAGVSPTELGVLDGLTASTAELNYNDITTLGTVQASKVVTADSNADVTFGDNDKAIFGAGSDLQIYHDGTSDKIESLSSYLILEGQNIILRNNAGTEDYAKFFGDGAVELYSDNSKKLATTSTGVDITGTLTSDGLTVDGTSLVNGSGTITSGGSAGIDTRFTVASTGNGGSGRGVGLVLAPAGSSNSVEAVRLVGLQETAASTANNASFVVQVANTSGTLTEATRINSSGITVSGTLDINTNDAAGNTIDIIGEGSTSGSAICTNWNTGSAYLDFRLGGLTTAYTEMRLYSGGDLHVDGNVIAYSTTISDERLKTDIVKIDSALDKVDQINGYTFTYTTDGKKSAGVIAQEVEKVLPSAITESKLPLKVGEDDETEYKTVQYDQLIGLLVEAVKELKAEVAELKGQ